MEEIKFPITECCDQGTAWRWHAYLPVVIRPTAERCILELTAQGAEQLTAAIAEYKTLRGIEILVERPSRRPNGRVRVFVVPGRKADTGLPPAPDVVSAMNHIWGFDDNHA